jgi:3-methyladenine DNA glycosylase AlkD
MMWGGAEIMTKAELLAAEIRKYCEKHAKPKLADKYQRYFSEGYEAWGGFDKDHPIWNAQEEEWFEKYHSMGLPGFLKLGEILFASGKYEEGALAIRFVKRFREKLDEKAMPGLARWFTAGIANWAHTDVLCGEILAPRITGGAVALEALAGWRSSGLKYQRRAVPVSMLGLLKVRVDFGPLLEFIRPMMLDPERVVHQGLGWFLREAWKKQPKPVEAFLLKWKDTAPRLIFQYATEKMTATARARFRRGKSR